MKAGQTRTSSSVTIRGRYGSSREGNSTSAHAADGAGLLVAVVVAQAGVGERVVEPPYGT